MYVFRVCHIDVRYSVEGKKQKEEPTFFRWCQHEGKRGAEEIASALVNFLDTEKTLWKKDATKLKLYCDGCAGQNKKRIVTHVLAYWLILTRFSFAFIPTIFFIFLPFTYFTMFSSIFLYYTLFLLSYLSSVSLWIYHISIYFIYFFFTASILLPYHN